MRPGPGGIADGGIEPAGEDQPGRPETRDPLQRLAECGSVLLRRDRLRQGQVEVRADPRPAAMRMAITAEIRIGEARVAVNRYGEHVAAIVEAVLLPVPVVVVAVDRKSVV